MALRQYKGASVETLISGSIGPTTTVFDIDDPTGWPTGGANGKFWATLYDDTTEETILVESQSAGTLTLTSSADRGLDDTSAGTWGAGTKIRHSGAALDFAEANAHINNPALDHHTQYMKADGTRHDLTARHSAGTVVPTATPSALSVGQSGAEGTGVNLARATHAHAVPKGTPVATGTVLTQGASGNFADASHIHTIGVGSINAANMFAAGVVDSAALGAASVIAGKIAAGGVSATNQIANAILTQALFSLENPTSYAPSFASFSNGAGGAFDGGTGGTTYGYYYKFGRLVIGWAGFSMAADGNLPSGSDIRIPLPFTQATLTTFRPICAARARLATVPATYASGLGVIVAGSTNGTNLATAGANAEWDATTPWNWGTPGAAVGATVDAFFAMISTT